MKISGAVFVQNFHEQQADHEVFLEDLKLAELFEPLGFDAIWSVEHHFSPYTMVPDVLQFLTYLCGHTRRIGLGDPLAGVSLHRCAHGLLAAAAATGDCSDSAHSG